MSVHAQREAAVIRAEWLGHLLCTAPADRPDGPALRGAAGGNPHTLVAEPGTCRWTTL